MAAGDLTYAIFAEELPELAVAADSARIETFIAQAETRTKRAEYSSTVAPGATRSQADLAVLFLAAHRYEMFKRQAASKGLASPGQVLGHSDGQQTVSYGKVGGVGAEERMYSTTMAGSMLLELRAAGVRRPLPKVAGYRGR